MPRSHFAPVVAFVTALAMGSTALAQTPPPAPPPGYGPAAPGYPPSGYPPPGYPPPGYPQGYAPPGYAGQGAYAVPGYGAPPPAATPPLRMDPDHPPPGYHTESRIRTGMAVGGGVMLGAAYLISAGVGAAGMTDDNRGLDPLFVPVVGPFVTLSTARVFHRTDDGLAYVGKVFGGIGLILDGVVQVAGLSLLVAGLAAQKQVVVRDRDEDISRVLPKIDVGPTGGSMTWQF
jgi:hypothetical protein